MTAAPSPSPCGLPLRDAAILVVFCGLLFGFSLVGGRPLTMHEAVLPETAREMFLDGDLVIPKSGNRPWLESPPAPQWITVGLAQLVGRCDEEWIVRLGPALAGIGIVLLSASMAQTLLGGRMGLLSGLVLATTFQFTRYAWLAEDEIFLCLLVNLAVWQFTRLEFASGAATPAESRRTIISALFGARSFGVIVLFLFLGLTNLAKGLGFGTVMAAAPMAVYLLLTRDFARIGRYTWFWGAAIVAAIAVAWPIAAYLRFPDVVDVWAYDHAGRLDGSYSAINKPVWYYPVTLLWTILPWTPLAIMGFVAMSRESLREPTSPARFLLCWAVAPIVVFSIPAGKHHHYLLQCLAPWLILATVGLREVGAGLARAATNWKLNYWPFAAFIILVAIVTAAVVLPIPGGAWMIPATGIAAMLAIGGVVAALKRGALSGAAASLFLGLGVVYALGHYYTGQHLDQCRHDDRFLREVPAFANAGEPVYVYGGDEMLEVFRYLFVLPPNTVCLHDLTFLRDEEIKSVSVLVLARKKEAPKLELLGAVETLARSERSRREKSLDDRLSLFRLTFHPNLVRLSAAGTSVSPMQAMGRAPGPFLGDPLEAAAGRAASAATSLRR